ncbi:LPS O-antigen length regulator [Vibrio campbellii]|uniref:LPS O-antigen length regulator n=1 Tax=Vibrio campbellii TaxID=680 RepID=UPI003452B771
MLLLYLQLSALTYSLLQPNIYTATATLSPAENTNGGGLSGMANQFGGLAALAGVNLSNNGVSQTELAVQVMKSRKFVSDFVQKHEILVPLMAMKGWDLNSNSLIVDNDVFDESSSTWLREPKGLLKSEPSLQEVYKHFISKTFNIVKGKDGGLYEISVTHFSPYVAQKWVNWLIEDINSVMRSRAIEESTQNLSYLNEQLAKTSVSEMQTTFYKLIEEQTKSLMLAEAQNEFIFKVVDPAIVPEFKSSPNRPMICILGTIIGFLVGLFIIAFRFTLTK